MLVDVQEFIFFFFNDTATTEIYTLSLHDALPIFMIDGGGYPRCHFHRACHPASVLVHVCDVYDALRTHRPYREAWEAARVLGYISERAGTEFDPDIARKFVEMMTELEGRVQRMAA